jgi:hypothetical protein
MRVARQPISRVGASRSIHAQIIGNRWLVIRSNGWLEYLVFRSSLVTGLNQAVVSQGFSAAWRQLRRQLDPCKGRE